MIKRCGLSGKLCKSKVWVEILAWCSYDFANSAFATLILTVAYSVYFKEIISGGGGRGDFLWGLSLSLAYLLVAISAPLLGAFSDQMGSRKKFLMAMTFLSILATASLSLLGPGQILAGMILFILGFFGFAMGAVFYNTFLLDISDPKTIGRISGLGWALGYLGGLASLGLCYPWISNNEFKTSFWLTSVFFLVFSIPTFVFVKSRQSRASEGLRASIQKSIRRLIETRRQLTQHRELLKFLIAYFFYNDGLSTIIVFSSIYAHDTFQMTMKEISLLFLMIQVSGFLGAFISGFWVDRFGARKTILGTLALWILTVLGAYLATTKTLFWAICLLAGLGVGSCQSASRSFVALATPASKSGEFFGFFAIFTKFSSILGPFLFGLASRVLESQRKALLTVLLFFIVGAVLLLRVKDRRPF